MKRLYAIDLDGTLLKNDKTVPPETKDCFSMIQSSGDVILLMTGRSYAETERYLRLLNIAGMVVCNDGKLILDNNGKIIEKCAELNHTDARIILKALKGLYYVLAFQGNAEYVIGNNWISAAVFFYKKIVRKRKVKFIFPWEQPLYLKDIDKFIIGSLNKEKLFEQLSRSLGNQYNIYNLTDEKKIQISGPEANKRNALQKIQKMLNINNEDIYVFGNDDNDRQVIAYYENSFVVSNACDGVKKVARQVIDSNENGGVIAKILELRGN